MQQNWQSSRARQSLWKILFPEVRAEQETLPCPGIAGVWEENVGETFLQWQHSAALGNDKTTFKPVSSSTVAWWLTTVLNKAGIDTSIFKAHSVRSAATSSASGAGVTTATILDAADWATETVFQRFYYKPKHNTTFGHHVLYCLSCRPLTEKPQTHVDMETEHSEI